MKNMNNFSNERFAMNRRHATSYNVHRLFQIVAKVFIMFMLITVHVSDARPLGEIITEQPALHSTTTTVDSVVVDNTLKPLVVFVGNASIHSPVVVSDGVTDFHHQQSPLRANLASAVVSNNTTSMSPPVFVGNISVHLPIVGNEARADIHPDQHHQLTPSSSTPTSSMDYLVVGNSNSNLPVFVGNMSVHHLPKVGNEARGDIHPDQHHQLTPPPTTPTPSMDSSIVSNHNSNLPVAVFVGNVTVHSPIVGNDAILDNQENHPINRRQTTTADKLSRNVGGTTAICLKIASVQVTTGSCQDSLGKSNRLYCMQCLKMTV